MILTTITTLLQPSDRVSPYFIGGAVLLVLGILAAILAALSKRRRNGNGDDE